MRFVQRPDASGHARTVHGRTLMKRRFAALLVALSVAAPTAAREANSPYAAIRAGVTLIDDATAKSTVTEEYSLDPGFAAGGAPGNAFGQFQVEDETSLKSASHCAGSPHTNAQRVDAPAVLTMATDVAP